jgi:hypothetical protein
MFATVSRALFEPKSDGVQKVRQRSCSIIVETERNLHVTVLCQLKYFLFYKEWMTN